MFKCECGREFENGQSFNGHKSHCRIHYLAKYGNDKKYNEQFKACTERIGIGSKKQQKQLLQQKNDQLLAWLDSKPTCEHCGKVMTEKFGSGRFCCRACANGHKHSEETKQKIAEAVAQTMQNRWAEHPEIWCKDKTFHQKRYCSLCGKEIKRVGKTDLCQNCLRHTEEGRAITSAKGKDSYQLMLSRGSHVGWQSRNITSYAETFWETVLTNNNIEFTREVPVKHDKSNYFLDFFFEVNGKKVDLEIDGKQHAYIDRAESDKTRDSYLQSLGYIIYRIPWNEINTQAGKVAMEEKINIFLTFYGSL